MKREDAEPFLRERNRGTLITLRRDGRAQSSNIAYVYGDDAARISVTADRAKTKNLARDGRAVLHVSSDDLWQYVSADGVAEISSVTTEPGDAVGVELGEIYEAVAGEAHPDWDEFYEAMVTEARVVITFRPSSFAGAVSR